MGAGIANASPEDRQLCEALGGMAERDGRIHVQELAENGGISANTNACFAMVQGEYTAMLDHDDMLTENALAEVVWLLQKLAGDGFPLLGSGYAGGRQQQTV